MHHGNAARVNRAYALAKIALEAYDLRDARLSFLRQGFVQVFRVESPTRGVYALRMYALPHNSPDPLRTGSALRHPETLRSQLLWLSALGRQTDLFVPEPVPTSDGSLITYASFEDLPRRLELLSRVSRRYADIYHPAHPGRHCVLLRWVSGRHKDKDLSLEDLATVGSYVAQLHDHAERYRISDDSTLPRWDWNWPFGPLAPLWEEGQALYSEDEMEYFRATAQRVKDDLGRLGQGKRSFGIIHRDLGLDNVVFDGGGVGAIDFDMCGLGYYLFDLSLILLYLNVHHQYRYPLLRDALFGGYQRERGLPEGYQRYIRSLATMQMVAAINRQLMLLRSEATARQARGPHFLENAITRLENLSAL